MSGMMMAMMGSGAGVSVGGTWTARNTSATSGVRSATITFVGDGTVTATSGSATWITPASSGVGANWWIRITATLTNGTMSATSGTWYQINSQVALSFTNSSATVETSGTATVAFSPDGGSTVYPGGTIAYDSGYTG